MARQKYIERELENNPHVYDKPRCNEFIDRQTLTHVICNVDCPEGVDHETCMKVLNEVAETLALFPYIKIAVPLTQPDTLHDEKEVHTMFEVIEKKTGKRLTVYSVDGDTFLVGVKDGFKLRSACDFAPVEQKDSAAPVETAPCVFTTAWKDTVDLDALLGGIASGAVRVTLGDMISTRLLDGTEVDFVVTDQDDKTVRLESRDCLGVNTSARELDSYLRKVYDLLPDALKSRIVETERVHLDSKGKKFTERCKLFLPAQSEIFPSDECYGDEGVYQQMDWYKDVHNRVRADRKGGDSCWYWTSSPRAGYTAAWCLVANHGYATYSAASYSNIAAPVCFRIPRI